MRRMIHGIKRKTKGIFNFRAWMDYDRLKGFGQGIFATIKRLFALRRSKNPRNFSQVVNELKLSPQVLQQHKRVFLRMTLLMLGLMVGLCGYAIYLLYERAYTGAAVGFAIIFLVAALAFRYHFLVFPAQARKAWLHI